MAAWRRSSISEMASAPEKAEAARRSKRKKEERRNEEEGAAALRQSGTKKKAARSDELENAGDIEEMLMFGANRHRGIVAKISGMHGGVAKNPAARHAAATGDMWSKEELPRLRGGDWRGSAARRGNLHPLQTHRCRSYLPRRLRGLFRLLFSPCCCWRLWRGAGATCSTAGGQKLEGKGLPSDKRRHC